MERSFRLNPRDSELAYSIGDNYLRQRRCQEAKAWLDRALSIDPEDYDFKIVRGLNSLMWKWDLGELRAQVKSIPADHIGEEHRIWVEILARNHKDALAKLGSLDI